MDEIREPCVAGLFYPDDTINLKRLINSYLSSVDSKTVEFFKKNSIDSIWGVIAPHAGYIYSGGVAAYSFFPLKNKKIDTVILIGPSHRAYFKGFALSYSKGFSTPLGVVEVDKELVNSIIGLSGGVFDFVDSAHQNEHSLEVQLPFIQSVIDEDFKIVPILMGEQSIENVNSGVNILYNVLKDYDKKYLIVISSDLSHYHNSGEAEKMDSVLMKQVEKLDSKSLIEKVEAGSIEACGAGPIALLMELAKKMGKTNVKNLKYKNSGDVSKDYERVVGYLSSVIW